MASPVIGGPDVPMTRSSPSRVVPFLFTDIEGSTRRWEADPDAMRAALQAHNEVVRGAVEAHAGQVVNYTGDGMCAVFASPRSAVDAAVGAQRVLELPVRMGIATGEAELRGENNSAPYSIAPPGDGGRPRRPSPARRHNGRSAQRSQPDVVGVQAVTRHRQTY